MVRARLRRRAARGGTRAEASWRRSLVGRRGRPRDAGAAGRGPRAARSACRCAVSARGRCNACSSYIDGYTAECSTGFPDDFEPMARFEPATYGLQNEISCLRRCGPRRVDGTTGGAGECTAAAGRDLSRQSRCCCVRLLGPDFVGHFARTRGVGRHARPGGPAPRADRALLAALGERPSGSAGTGQARVVEAHEVLFTRMGHWAQHVPADSTDLG